MSDNISLEKFIDIRLKGLEDTLNQKFANLESQITSNEKNNATRRHELMDGVTKLNFKVDNLENQTKNYPIIEKIVFTGVGLVLVAVTGGIISLVVIK